MKIAEALIQRTAMTSKLEDLKSRMAKNVKVQEGDAPQENVAELMKTYLTLYDELTELICRINKTNQIVKGKDDIPLSDMLATRDKYKTLVKKNKTLYDEAILVSRYSRMEIRLVSAVDVSMLQDNITEYSQKYREIDTEIQGINWTTDLVE